jgi:UPF0716 protein FxsA
MWWRLAVLAVLALPVAEVVLLVRLAGEIGAGYATLWVLGAALLGFLVARSEGLAVLQQLATDADGGARAADRVAEGALVLLGAALLAFPGVLTDALAVPLLLPPARRWLAPRLVARFRGSVSGVHFRTRNGRPPGSAGAPPPDGPWESGRPPSPAADRKATPFTTPFD